MKKENATIIQWGGGWPDSIGNAFIDFGSMTALSAASGERNIVLSSNFPRSYFARGFFSNKTRLLDGVLRDSVKHLFDIREFLKADFIILSGEILSKYWIDLCVPERFFKKSGPKIIIHGGGGTNYTEKEFDAVRAYLKRMNLYAFISRDENIFRQYNGIAEHSFNGVDCAFFLSDYFKPALVNLPPYVTYTFDKMAEPKIISKNSLIIRTHHAYWSQSGFTKNIVYYNRENLRKENTLISDLPQDYLNVYFNTSETHSDRVHACVPTLTFGKPARLYVKTPRAALFSRINCSSITEKLTLPDKLKIEHEKAGQIQFIKEILGK